MEKRSIAIAGHRTSVALEPPFWQALENMAQERASSMAALVRHIDDTRSDANLASALRLAVLAWYQAKLSATAPE